MQVFLDSPMAISATDLCTLPRMPGAGGGPRQFKIGYTTRSSGRVSACPGTRRVDDAEQHSRRRPSSWPVPAWRPAEDYATTSSTIFGALIAAWFLSVSPPRAPWRDRSSIAEPGAYLWRRHSCQGENPTFNGFAHADQAELLAWQRHTGAGRTSHPGEEATMRQFATRLVNTRVEMPALHQGFELQEP